MKTKFYIDGKKVTRKAVLAAVGEKRFKKILEEAKEVFLEDPLIDNSFWIGKGILTIIFDF